MDAYSLWMVGQNVNYARTEGLEVVLNRLKAQGYYAIAAAVEAEFKEKNHEDCQNVGSCAAKDG